MQQIPSDRGGGPNKKKSPYQSISANKQILLNNNSEASLHEVELDRKPSAQDNYYMGNKVNGTDNLLQKNMITPVQHRH